MSLAVYSKSKCKVYTVSKGQESGRLLVHTRAALKIMGHCWICVISVCIPLSTWILWICKLTNRYFVVSSLLFFKIYLYQQATTSERKRNFYFWILFQLSCSFIFFWLLQLKTKSTQNGEFKNTKKKGKSERHRVGFLYRRSSSFRVPNLPSMNSTGNIHTILQLYLRRNNKAVDTRLPRFRDRPLFFPFRVYVLWKEKGFPILVTSPIVCCERERPLVFLSFSILSKWKRLLALKQCTG